MHLLKLNSNGELSLTSFSEIDAPPYAILSHTWDTPDQEVTFEDIGGNSGRTKKGWNKVSFCGIQAQKDGLNHFWIDSCCIDKSSSAELSKAINSMFRFYRNAERCYVYLGDVSMTAGVDRNLLEPRFRNSRWFTRGWTLQELLAPRIVEFFSKEGHKLGDKVNLEGVIHDVTGVAPGALRGDPLSQYSVQERFSWAEKRQTTEPEDQAYSLLGIFDVFLPLIYGEGEEHALNRLREAIEQGVNRKRKNPEQGGAAESASQEEGRQTKKRAPERTKAVQVIKPNDPTSDIIIRMHLGGPTAPDMVRKLTGAELTRYNGKQQVVLPNGTLITPMPFMHIDGFEDEGIEQLFPPGTGVIDAIRDGNTYKKEKKKEPVPKSCVSFLIPADQQADIILELSIGRELGNALQTN